MASVLGLLSPIHMLWKGTQDHPPKGLRIHSRGLGRGFATLGQDTPSRLEGWGGTQAEGPALLPVRHRCQASQTAAGPGAWTSGWSDPRGRLETQGDSSVAETGQGLPGTGLPVFVRSHDCLTFSMTPRLKYCSRELDLLEGFLRQTGLGTVTTPLVLWEIHRDPKETRGVSSRDCTSMNSAASGRLL